MYLRQTGAGAMGWGRWWWRGAVPRGSGQGVARGTWGYGVWGGDIWPWVGEPGEGGKNRGRLGNGAGFGMEGEMGWKEEKKKK